VGLGLIDEVGSDATDLAEGTVERQMSQASVLVTQRDCYRVITLNRPDRLNAFTGAMHQELRTALDDTEADRTCRAILITGAGRGFCAGQDLSDPEVAVKPGETPDLSITLETHYNPLIRHMRALPIPIVCAVNGVAAGAGVSIALACDVVIASSSASFGQAFVKIGLMPDSGGTWFLPRLIGPARARIWAMTGETVSADLAVSWGLIHKAVAAEMLMSEAEALCARFAQSSPAALAAIKAAIDHASDASLNDQLNYERDGQRLLGAGPDYAEGVAAFKDKRKPVFGQRA
jgi:2-(1,2-epoxy-1,2-dihydrophenyl)acetyl-CoA isomerase